MGDEKPKKRILIIEDEEDTSKVIMAVLSRSGYYAEIALNGEEALEKVSLNNFDLFFLDVSLPGMSGLEVYRHIKSIFPGAKMCIMTGWSKGFDAQRDEYLSLVREGALDKMLRKPFGHGGVLAVAKSILGG